MPARMDFRPHFCEIGAIDAADTPQLLQVDQCAQQACRGKPKRPKSEVAALQRRRWAGDVAGGAAMLRAAG